MHKRLIGTLYKLLHFQYSLTSTCIIIGPYSIKDCLEGHLGIFPGDEYELEKEIKFLRDIPMSQVIEVWKVVVFYKKQLELKIGSKK